MTNLGRLKSGLVSWSCVNQAHNRVRNSSFLYSSGFVFYLSEHRYGVRLWVFRRYEQQSVFQFSITEDQIEQAVTWLLRFLSNRTHVVPAPFAVSGELSEYGSDCRYLWSADALDRAAKS